MLTAKKLMAIAISCLIVFVLFALSRLLFGFDWQNVLFNQKHERGFDCPRIGCT